jgi:hypothetical protein
MAVRSPGQCHAGARTGPKWSLRFSTSGRPQAVQLVLHLFERLYELGLAGTFLTTNLLARDLVSGEGMLGSRLISRCAETLVTVDFSDGNDWWQKVKSRA